MGNNILKIVSRNNENEEETSKAEYCKEKGDTENRNVYSTPVNQRKLSVDPRSVTAGIQRTPIEVNCTPVGITRKVITAIPRHLQTPYLETDIDRVMPVLTPKKCSPKLEEVNESAVPILKNESEEKCFILTDNTENCSKAMTPIQKECYEISGLKLNSENLKLPPKSLARLKARSRENLNRCCSYESDCCSSRHSTCEVSPNVGDLEILSIPDVALHGVKSLYLNIEYDDNTSESGSSCSSYSSGVETVLERGEDISVIENRKLNAIKVNREMQLNTSLIDQESLILGGKLLETEDVNMVALKQNSTGKDIQNRQMSANDRIKIWRDSLSIEDMEEDEFVDSDKTEFVKDETTEIPKEEVIITFDDSDVKASQLLTTKTGTDYLKSAEVINKKKKIFKSDEKKIFNSGNRTGNECLKTRTPLGNRSNNDQLQILSMKSPQQLFRNKGMTPKGLQENASPHKKFIAKPKVIGMQWDPDSTVII